MTIDDQVTRLRRIAVTITEDNSIPLKIDTKANCSCTDYKTITIAPQMIPEGITDPATRNVLLEGTTIHESEHIRWTKALREYYKDWENSQVKGDLARQLHGIMEDCRIDKMGMARWRTDYGPRRKKFLNIVGEAQAKTFLMDKETNMTDVINAWLSHSKYGFSVSERFNKKHRRLLKKMYNITEIAKRTGRIRASKQLRKTAPGLLDILDDLYKLVNEEFPDDNIDQSKIPKNEGGGRVIKGENPEDDEDEKESSPPNNEKDAESHGKGTGLNIQAPDPNKMEYNRLVCKNEGTIQRMLRRIKNEQVTRVITHRFRPHGRLMTEIAASLLAQSMNKEVTNPYERRKIIYEKGKVSLGLLVDVSGSVSWDDALDVLTIIGEVGGRWLKEEDLAILAFASEYVKIKVFVEQYWNTSARIGGLYNDTTGLGGCTEMHPPLAEFTSMFNAFNGNGKKIMVIVSDFSLYPEDSDAVKREIKKLEMNGVTVIGVGLSRDDLFRAREHCGHNATAINDITDLPERFFQIWHQATTLRQHV